MTVMASSRRPPQRAPPRAAARGGARAPPVWRCSPAAAPRATRAPIAARELAEAQTFPYYRVYWVGPRFDGHALAAADGLQGYIPPIGDSVYYGDCVRGKGIFGGGSCQLPLQVTTVIYRLHSNAAARPAAQHARARRARGRLRRRPLDRDLQRAASRSMSSPTRSRTRCRAAARAAPAERARLGPGTLPPPVYCPGLYGPIGPPLAAS